MRIHLYIEGVGNVSKKYFDRRYGGRIVNGRYAI